MTPGYTVASGDTISINSLLQLSQRQDGKLQFTFIKFYYKALNATKFSLDLVIRQIWRGP